MANYPSLNYIPIELLLAVGDPWRVDATLQSGDPGEISELATAFRDAGECTTETFNEFAQARERFQASWNHENGGHPIDDSAAVQRATARLLVQKDQLPLIAVELQNIAADLAEAETQSASTIDELNGKLELLDIWVGDAIADGEGYSTLLSEAEALTGLVLNDIERIQDGYTDKLEQAAFDLRRKHGYDPAAIEDVDGDASPEERGRTAPEHYGANQRANDEALVGGPDPWTPEKDAAAARLRDFAIATDPQLGAETRELATQRLDDFRMTNFVGGLPRDPLTGADARSRAAARIELQRQFEQGYLGLPPMTPDEATQRVNDGESAGRVMLTKDVYRALTAAGMSGIGAATVVSGIAGTVGNAADLVPRGGRARFSDYLNASDAAVFGKIVGHVSRAADVVQLGIAIDEWRRGGEHQHEKFGDALGGVFGGGGAAWAVGIGAASITGPWTTAALVVIAGAAGGIGGSEVGSTIGRQFDLKPTG